MKMRVRGRRWILLLFGACLLYRAGRRSREPAGASAAADARWNSSARLLLLIWTHPFGVYRPLPDCWARFNIAGCVLTDSWPAYPYADAVVVHHREIADGDADLPPEPRPPHQKWIWMNYESPTNTYALPRVEGAFNLTMTYRTDSDIFLPYGYLVPRTSASALNPRPLRVRSREQVLRPRLLAWVVSNWSPSHARVLFYYMLRRYVRVDVFGRAGRPVPGGDVVRILEYYQFYLALENSQHTDYITEKLWNAVLAGAIPVVLGPPRRNYERFLPPQAFIHVDDFPTVRELAQYLVTVSHSSAQLMQHLEWRERYSVHVPPFWDEHYCTACRAARKTKGQTTVVRHITQWFES
ncbi:alpha-(1,3)-fucosyltransferase 4-like [Thalassophryne amazonica]|uniref:alpha-(1,3)-fucosyltransferase 4-like n=1 Tax=Thalassophryne amazonica TaxID=390379 RepID=UPI001470F7B7|nr:alpha-(1,3)-fucosyltransferase 4-like [Thalassophryne amazonica]